MAGAEPRAVAEAVAAEMVRDVRAQTEQADAVAAARNAGKVLPSLDNLWDLQGASPGGPPPAAAAADGDQGDHVVLDVAPGDGAHLV
jgi:hypothetical protein